MPGRTWTIRLTGHSDHSATVTCSTAGCRMPARSKDLHSLRVFAAEHVRAHARLASPRPNAACACGASDCRHHAARTTCTGRALLVLIHNPAVAEVWTLAEICQACAPQISHASVLAGAGGAGGDRDSLAARAAAATAAAAGTAGPPAGPSAGGAAAAPPAPAAPVPPAVPMMFSSPEAAGGSAAPLPSPHRRRARRGGGRGGQGGQGGQGGGGRRSRGRS
ncbi:hypothetical protein RGF97_32870 [Streptomyces roseicoloratus]|uniref:Post-SET domain-containing protein n=1 Tax=Streptomyces roseicoloratus TaxID=2508722 RepID=A0ABY9S305_9ACTN|nr:hypothetical protein [Streptomyces roseicoloratus]WMX48632.1 hypothetical protein RGF97_32870 [Streptomyces roseicoloratus]